MRQSHVWARSPRADQRNVFRHMAAHDPPRRQNRDVFRHMAAHDPPRRHRVVFRPLDLRSPRLDAAPSTGGCRLVPLSTGWP
jgi:hypothetical protein